MGVLGVVLPPLVWVGLPLTVTPVTVKVAPGICDPLGTSSPPTVSSGVGAKVGAGVIGAGVMIGIGARVGRLVNLGGLNIFV